MKKNSVRKNIKKKVLTVLLRILLLVAILPFVLSILFLNPAVQTFTAKLVANMITKSIGQQVSINSIHIGVFNGIDITGLKFGDHKNNALLSVGNLSAKPVLTNLSLSNLKFLSIELDNIAFNLGSYKDDSINNLALILDKIKSDDTATKSNNLFKLFSGSVIIKNSRFNLFNEHKNFDHEENTMDYANIVIDSISIDISDFKLIGDSLNFRINNISAREKSGITVKKMSADFILSSTGLYTNNTLLTFGNSSVDADFGMRYESYESFQDYIDSVDMIADVRPTRINMADLGYFSSILYEMPNVVGITGKMTGPVRHMKGKDLKLKFGDNTRISGDINFVGLPDFQSTLMDGTKLFITTTPKEISEFYLPIDEKHIDISGIIADNEQISVSGNFHGYYKNFSSSADIITRFGQIKSNVKFTQSPNNYISFNVGLTCDTVNIGGLLNQNKLLGKISFNISASGKGESAKKIEYTSKGKLTKVDLLGYNYRKITYEGNYADDSVKVDLQVGDENLMMTASATALLAEKNVFTLNTDIIRAKLNKLNLWYDQNINLATHIDAKVTGTDINTLNANVLLTRCKFVFNKNKYEIDSINLTKKTDPLLNTEISLTSDIIDVDIIGNYNITTLVESILGIPNHYYNLFPGKEKKSTVLDNYANISADIKKPKIFGKEFLSGIYFAPNTKLTSKFNFKNNEIDLNLSSSKIKIRDIILDSSSLNVYTKNNYLFSEFSLSRLILKDSTPEDSIVFGIDDFSLSARIGNDSLLFGTNWDNHNEVLKNSGILEGYISTTLDSTKFSIGKSEVYINDIPWNIDPNNLVVYSNNRIFFHNIHIEAGKSELKLIGTVPKNENDSLEAEFSDWDLSYFDLVTMPLNINLDGKINGSLKLSIINNNPTLVSNINIKDLYLNKEYLGDARILNTWDNTNNSIFIKSQIIRQGDAGRGEVFLADGYYYPTKKEDNLNINVSFNRFKLKTLEPFLYTFINQLEGTTSGKLAITGSPLKPVVIGSIDMQRTSLRVVYLNTKYSFSNSIEFVKNGIKFDKLIIYDTLGNQANVNGTLTYENLNKPTFDAVISTPGLLFFNTNAHMNELYYGTAMASGDLVISGNPHDVDLNIKIKTQKGTSVVLPLNYSVEISDKDYIIFTKPDLDSISENKIIDITEIQKKNKLKYNIAVNLEVTPDALVKISLPADMGSIEAQGSSFLDLGVDSDGKFSLVGDYVVSNGTFHFKIGNLVSKRFTLVNGGRISWSGSPYSANVNIKGMYKVKTSLSSLGIVVDSTTSYKNKATVECYVVLTGELLNPNIKFEIKLPDIDPDLQRAVFSELDTTNAAMMNQQMISLLVLGTFNFNNASNVSLQSSYYNVIANQLSSMLSQISENVDIGLNYKPGDEVSQQEFEVALSTQLFDDRLTIDGNFGMTYDRGQQSASNIVGDVDIGYKLTPDGQWVLKVFNHSNVNSWYNPSNYDQISPYTQGVGIAFRKDFNKLSQLFESKKKENRNKKKDKQNKEIQKPDDEENQ